MKLPDQVINYYNIPRMYYKKFWLYLVLIPGILLLGCLLLKFSQCPRVLFNAILCYSLIQCTAHVLFLLCAVLESKKTSSICGYLCSFFCLLIAILNIPFLLIALWSRPKLESTTSPMSLFPYFSPLLGIDLILIVLFYMLFLRHADIYHIVQHLSDAIGVTVTHTFAVGFFLELLASYLIVIIVNRLLLKRPFQYLISKESLEPSTSYDILCSMIKLTFLLVLVLLFVIACFTDFFVQKDMDLSTDVINMVTLFTLIILIQDKYTSYFKTDTRP